jgi:hypothetical protein
MSDYTERIIKDMAETIRGKIQGGMLYGDPVDMTDPDAVLAAAYLIGQQEESAKGARRFELLYELTRK